MRLRSQHSQTNSNSGPALFVHDPDISSGTLFQETSINIDSASEPPETEASHISQRLLRSKSRHVHEEQSEETPEPKPDRKHRKKRPSSGQLEDPKTHKEKKRKDTVVHFTRSRDATLTREEDEVTVILDSSDLGSAVSRDGTPVTESISSAQKKRPSRGQKMHGGGHKKRNVAAEIYRSVAKVEPQSDSESGVRDISRGGKKRGVTAKGTTGKRTTNRATACDSNTPKGDLFVQEETQSDSNEETSEEGEIDAVKSERSEQTVHPNPTTSTELIRIRRNDGASSGASSKSSSKNQLKKGSNPASSRHEYRFFCSGYPQCPHGVNSRKALRIHEKGHEERGRLKCFYCDWSTNRLDHRDLHMAFHPEHREQQNKKNDDSALRVESDAEPPFYDRYPCDQCNKVFKRSDHLQSHKTVHSAEKRFQCGKCVESFRRKSDWKKHEETCKSVECYVADCDKRFRNETSVEVHVAKEHSEIACKECGIAYTFKSGLRRHNRLKHPGGLLYVGEGGNRGEENGDNERKLIEGSEGNQFVLVTNGTHTAKSPQEVGSRLLIRYGSVRRSDGGGKEQQQEDDEDDEEQQDVKEVQQNPEKSGRKPRHSNNVHDRRSSGEGRDIDTGSNEAQHPTRSLFRRIVSYF